MRQLLPRYSATVRCERKPTGVYDQRQHFGSAGTCANGGRYRLLHLIAYATPDRANRKSGRCYGEATRQLNTCRRCSLISRTLRCLATVSRAERSSCSLTWCFRPRRLASNVLLTPERYFLNDHLLRTGAIR